MFVPVHDILYRILVLCCLSRSNQNEIPVLVLLTNLFLINNIFFVYPILQDGTFALEQENVLRC